MIQLLVVYLYKILIDKDSSSFISKALSSFQVGKGKQEKAPEIGL